METELEFRFGTHTHRGFSSCVSRDMYYILYNRCIHLGIVFSDPTVNYVSFYRDHIRLINNKAEIKTTSFKKDFYIGTYCIRYCESSEVPVDPSTLEDKAPEWMCVKSRKSGVYMDDVKVEFTILNDTIYQVEIEIPNRETMHVADELLKQMCRWSYLPTTVSVCPVSVGHYRNVLTTHNKVFRYTGYNAWYKPNKPIDIPIPIPDLSEYIVTFKYDGVRGFLCNIDNITYWVNMQGIICLEKVSIPNNTVLDVECMTDGMVILDTIIWKGTDMRSYTALQRREIIDPDFLPVWIKPMRTFSLRNIREAWDMSVSSVMYDGIILRHEGTRYWEEKNYKIKPINKQTIDLEVKSDGAYAYSKLIKNMVKWVDISRIIGGDDLELGIWEFQHTCEGILPVRKRDDRRYPNTVETINSVLFISRGIELVDVISKQVIKGE